jgi:hypothetical protein
MGDRTKTTAIPGFAGFTVTRKQTEDSGAAAAGQGDFDDGVLSFCHLLPPNISLSPPPPFRICSLPHSFRHALGPHSCALCTVHDTSLDGSRSTAAVSSCQPDVDNDCCVLHLQMPAQKMLEQQHEETQKTVCRRSPSAVNIPLLRM